ncbi:DUF5317 domain-containing protein [Candidatus Acetothermia bacterium]|nr:DUF5317 domain-containing protein [Candidatus Acetothermia bacterium]
MVLLWASLLGLLIGFLRRGTVANLSHLHLRCSWLILVALLIQLAIFPTGLFEPPIKWGIPYWHLASYGALVLFALLNWRERALWPMTVGLISNFVVIAVNQGYMPASLDAVDASGAHHTAAQIRETGIHANIIRLCAQPEVEHCRQTYLNSLSDIFGLPSWLPGARPISIGDILLALGLIYFLQRKMRSSAQV